jgi:hypothetical protein
MKLREEYKARADTDIANADKREVRADLGDASADKKEANANTHETKVNQKNASLASLLDDDASSTSNAQASGQPSQQKTEIKAPAAPEKPASEPAPTQPKQVAATPKSSAAPKPA